MSFVNPQNIKVTFKSYNWKAFFFFFFLWVMTYILICSSHRVIEWLQKAWVPNHYKLSLYKKEQHGQFSEHPLLYSNEERKQCGFGKTRGRVNNDWIFISLIELILSLWGVYICILFSYIDILTLKNKARWNLDGVIRSGVIIGLKSLRTAAIYSPFYI